ncbi:MAG: aspartate carbamoyltransferase [Clostridiales bacterium]|nr:aspartate carbamoyltransferase [Clostridiales bacterium]
MSPFSGKPSPAGLAPFAGRDLLDFSWIGKEELRVIMQTAAYYEEALKEKKRLYDMDGKLMASLFYEPSTRTRLSFEAAMHRLGGGVVTVAESSLFQISSTAKGEKLPDTVKVIEGYVDILVCRSPEVGSAAQAAEHTLIPVINAGDGVGEHPTQALLDIYTIIKEKGGVDGLTIVLAGDLKNGRTVHSLADALSLYDCRLLFCSPAQFGMPAAVINKLKGRGVRVEECCSLDEAAARADVLYMTRVQGERFEGREEFVKTEEAFILTNRHMGRFRPGALIMHPLPRLNEIAPEVDSYPGAAYFRQAANGLFVRMALLALLTGSVK